MLIGTESCRGKMEMGENTVEQVVFNYAIMNVNDEKRSVEVWGNKSMSGRINKRDCYQYVINRNVQLESRKTTTDNHHKDNL